MIKMLDLKNHLRDLLMSHLKLSKTGLTQRFQMLSTSIFPPLFFCLKIKFRLRVMASTVLLSKMRVWMQKWWTGFIEGFLSTLLAFLNCLNNNWRTVLKKSRWTYYWLFGKPTAFCLNFLARPSISYWFQKLRLKVKKINSSSLKSIMLNWRRRLTRRLSCEKTC